MHRIVATWPVVAFSAGGDGGRKPVRVVRETDKK